MWITEVHPWAGSPVAGFAAVPCRPLPPAGALARPVRARTASALSARARTGVLESGTN